MTSNEDNFGGGPPSAGWQPMVCALLVEDIAASRAFWCDLVGFAVAYERSAEGFVYLERRLPDDRVAQVMLRQRNGSWETGPMIRPLGQGVMFQLEVGDLSVIVDAMSRRNWPVHTPLREVWRQTGNRETGQKEIFVQDPDGYLLMLNQSLGERPLDSGVLV